MKHVLCDVDGVVIHGFHTKLPNRSVWSKNLEADLGVKESDLIEAYFKKSFLDVLDGKIGLIESLIPVLPELGYSGKIEDFIQYWFEKDSKTNLEFLEFVKSNNDRMNFYLATNQEHLRANYLWERLGFNRHFKSIFYAAKIGVKKPSPLFFEYILDEIKAPISDICFIDDDAKNISTAKSLGIESILFNDMDDVNNHPFFR